MKYLSRPNFHSASARQHMQSAVLAMIDSV